MKIRLVENITEFNELHDSWNQLLDRCKCRHIQLTHEYLSIWLKHFGREGKLFVLLAEENGELLGIAPLIIQKVGKFYKNLIKFDRLSFVGVNFSDSADFIIPENHNEIIEQFFNYIFDNQNKWDEISLRQISSGSHSFKYIQNSNIYKGFDWELNDIIGVPYLKISEDFETYFSDRAKLFKKQIRRYTRKLEAIGEIKFEIIEEITPEILGEILEINKKRNLETNRRSIFLSNQKLACIKEIIEKFAPLGWMKLFCLRLETEMLCYDLTFDYRGVIYDWNTSFNLEYDKYSPGRLLNKFIIQYCFENNYNEYNLMAGDEDYKFKWTDTQSRNHDLFVSKRNLSSKLLNLYGSTVKRLKKNGDV